MEGGRTPGSSLGPCPECGEPLPVGTQRYCVHCGAEVVPVGGTPSWFDAASATRPAPITPSPRPGASRRPTTWSSGDYRAPSPTDAEGLAIPPVPAGDEEWNGPVSDLIRTGEQAVAAEGAPEGTGPVDAGSGAGSTAAGMPVAPPPAGSGVTMPVPPPTDASGWIAVPPLAAWPPVPAGPGGAAPGAAFHPGSGEGGPGDAPSPDPLMAFAPYRPPGTAPVPPPGGPGSSPALSPSAPVPFPAGPVGPPGAARRPGAPGAGGPSVPGTQVGAPVPLQAPGGQPAPGRGRAVPVIVAAVLALVAVTAGVLLWVRSRDAGDPLVSANPVSAPVTSTTDATPSGTDATTAGGVAGAAGDVTPGAPSSPAAGSSAVSASSTSASALTASSTTSASATVSAAAFAAGMDKLLDESAAARTDVTATVAALQSCRTAADKASAKLRAAGKARSSLATRADGLDGTGVPGGKDVLDAFVSMQQASAAADDAFADWADEVSKAGCRSSAPRTMSWALGNQHSGEATTAKDRFVRLWNPLAAAHDLRARTTDGI